MRAYFRPGVDLDNFGRGMPFWIRLHVYYCEYKNGRDLDAKKGVNKPLKIFHCWGVIRSFSKEGAPDFDIFSSVVFFSGELIWSKLRNKKKASEGPRVCSPQYFWKFTSVKAILVHFEQFSSKLHWNFLPLILSASPVSIQLIQSFDHAFSSHWPTF